MVCPTPNMGKIIETPFPINHHLRCDVPTPNMGKIIETPLPLNHHLGCGVART